MESKVVDNTIFSPYQRAELLSDAGVMREFRATPYYKVFCKYIALLVEQFQARAMSGTKEEFEYWKGAYHGARDAGQLPESVITMAASAQENRAEAAKED